jgi:hypothetical protein
METEIQAEPVPLVCYEVAERLRSSRRVLFEKVARRPSEYLTVLTGFNNELLIAFAWQCCEFLDENNHAWFKYQQIDDDCFDWVVAYHDMGELLNELFRKNQAEVFHMEWNVHISLAFRSLE